MRKEKRKKFIFPPADPNKSDKENAMQSDRYAKRLRRWLKGKHVSGKMIEEDGIVTFTYIATKTAAIWPRSTN